MGDDGANVAAGPTWLQVQLVGGRVDGQVWCTAVGELPVGRPVGAGGALANVHFYPPATLRSKHQDLHSPHIAHHLLHRKRSFLPLCWAGDGLSSMCFMAITKQCRAMWLGVPRVLSLVSRMAKGLV